MKRSGKITSKPVTKTVPSRPATTKASSSKVSNTSHVEKAIAPKTESKHVENKVKYDDTKVKHQPKPENITYSKPESKVTAKEKAELERLERIANAKAALPSAVKEANEAYEVFNKAKDELENVKQHIKLHIEEAKESRPADTPTGKIGFGATVIGTTLKGATIGKDIAGWQGAIVLGFSGALIGVCAGIIEGGVGNAIDNNDTAKQDKIALENAEKNFKKAEDNFTRKDEKLCELIKEAGAKEKEVELHYPLKLADIKKEFRI